VQTDGVVTIDMFTANAKAILNYMYKSPLNYSGILFHIEPPAAGLSTKANNAYLYVDEIVKLIADIPLQYRVGFQATVEEDSVWSIAPSQQVLQPHWVMFDGNAGYYTLPAYPEMQQCSATTPCKGAGQVCGAGNYCVPQAMYAACKDYTSPTNPVGFDITKDRMCLGAQAVPASGSKPAQVIPDGALWQTSSTCGCAQYIDATNNGTIITSSLPPGFSLTDNHWYGGAGAPAPASAVTSSGYPYQAGTASSYDNQQSCPYKILPPFSSLPVGCPNNLAHLGWYTALVNAKLRALGSGQRISMMNWDSEGNGPDGAQCSIFQFLYALRQYGTSEDVLPPIGPADARVNAPWVLYQNGAAGMSQAMDAASDTVPCGNWKAVDINIGKAAGGNWQPPPAGVTTFGEMAIFQPAPEIYWGNGQDMGGVADGGPTVDTGASATTGANGMLKTLIAAGYIGCPQSAAGKPGFDANCGCRNTVYETYAHVPDGGKRIIDALCPWYDEFAATIPNVTPTFSIEHIGSPSYGMNFDLCINSRNGSVNQQPSGPGTSSSTPNIACAQDDKCVPRCGVANFFGNFSEQCFKQFLDAFAAKYKAKSMIVYDAGFIPQSWLSTSSEQAACLPSAPATTTPVPDLSTFLTNQASQGIDWSPTCPTSSGELVRYKCGTGPGVGQSLYSMLPLGSTGGATIPQDLRCWGCVSDAGKSTCTFLAGDDGTNPANYKVANDCPCASGPLFNCGSQPGTYTQVTSTTGKGAPSSSTALCWGCTAASVAGTSCVWLANSDGLGGKSAVSSGCTCAAVVKPTVWHCGASATDPPKSDQVSPGAASSSAVQCYDCKPGAGCSWVGGNGVAASFASSSCDNKCSATPRWHCGETETSNGGVGVYFDYSQPGATSSADTLCYSCTDVAGTSAQSMCQFMPNTDGTQGVYHDRTCAPGGTCAAMPTAAECGQSKNWSNPACRLVCGTCTAERAAYCAAQPQDSACGAKSTSSKSPSSSTVTPDPNSAAHATSHKLLNWKGAVIITAAVVVVVAIVATIVMVVTAPKRPVGTAGQRGGSRTMPDKSTGSVTKPLSDST
jgi:hypothetical protein